MDVDKLKKAIHGQVLRDQETLEDVRTDFGRIIQKIPRALILPASVEDVKRVIEIAFREGGSVSTRGAGHSQSGQSLSEGGLLLDMTGLNHIGPLEAETVWAEAGVLWSELVCRTAEQGFVPPVLTNNLSVTVGGTLSTAGLGVASHRFGTQADNIEELEVVTGEGHLVRCSKTNNQELFDCTRGGLGQCSIIVRARLKLRKFLPCVRTYFLLYHDLKALMRDQEVVIEENRADYVECWASACPQGFRTVGEAKMPFAEWFYPMHLTLEYADQPPRETGVLSDLRFYRKVHTEDAGLLEFANRLEPVFNLWKESGTWNFTHPWMEAVLPWSKAAPYIQGVLQSFPPNLLIGGHVLMWPARGTISEAPLFKHPDGEFVMGFGMLPAVPKAAAARVLPLLNKASDLCMAVGGKRYLSGWIDFDHAHWKAHFADTWEQLLKWKRFYDPKGILNPGFIKYLPES